MDRLKGKLTVGRRGIIGEDYISIELKDDSSLLKVLELDIPLDDLMRALTGLASVECEYTLNKKATNLFGKTQEVKTITMPSSILENVYDKETKSRLVNIWFGEQQFLGNIPEEWRIKCDGTTIRQDKTGEHKIVIQRFV